jgi:AcrR family transcriptional regulator
MREISRESGWPAPSIYYHFTSKSNLYKEAYSHKIEQTMDLIDERLQGQNDRRQRFIVLIEAFFDLFTGDRTLLLLMQRDVIDASVTRRRFLSKRQYDYFTSLIQTEASQMRGRPVCSETAVAVGSLIFGYCELSTMAHEIYDRHGPDVLLTERDRLVRAALAIAQMD